MACRMDSRAVPLAERIRDPGIEQQQLVEYSPATGRARALHRLVELAPGRCPIAGARERFGSIAERFARPGPMPSRVVSS